MSELKPCPFCGGKAHVVQNDYPTPFGAHDVLFAVECTVRGCYAKTTEWYPKSSAVRAWNTRPTDERVQRLVELVNQVLAASQKLDAAIDTTFSDADLEMHYTHFAQAVSRFHLLTYDGGPLTKALEAL